MEEAVLELDSVDTALAVFGNCDANIRLLEQEFGVTAVCRGTQVKLTGGEEDVRRAAARWMRCCACARAAHRWRNRRCATASRWPAAARRSVSAS